MKYIYNIVIAIALISLMSCSEDFFNKAIDLDIDDNVSKLATTALLGSEENLIMVSYTSNPLDNNDDNQIVENAVVTLSNSDAIFTIQYDFYQPDININFIPNTSYTLNIEAPNFQTVSSKQIYPEPVEILEASLIEKVFTIKINDDPSKANYYLLKLETSISEVPLDPYSSFSDTSSTCGNCVIFSDETFDGEEGFEISTNLIISSDNSIHKAVLYNITEDYYRYDRTLKLNENENPFSEPVILHRNFENGYGVFALSNKTELSFTP